MTFNPPPRDDFPQPAIHSALTLDRMAEKRGDRAWVKRRLEDKNSRFLLFADLLLAVDSNADRSETRTRWYAAKDLVIEPALSPYEHKGGTFLWQLGIGFDQANDILARFQRADEKNKPIGKASLLANCGYLVGWQWLKAGVDAVVNHVNL